MITGHPRLGSDPPKRVGPGKGKYAPEILVSEEEKCRRFEDGLNDHIRAHVTVFCHEDFSKFVTCALNVERVKKEERARKDKRHGKKNPGQSSS